MKVTCPKCESEDVQRLAMIYQHGTATSMSTGSTLAGVGDDLAVAATVTSGKQQSLLAQQAAPPQPQSGSPIFVFPIGLLLLVLSPAMLLMGLLGEPFDMSRPENRAFLLGTGGLFALFGFLILRESVAMRREAAKYNRTTYPRLKEEWDRTWLCLRCGNRFEANV